MSDDNLILKIKPTIKFVALFLSEYLFIGFNMAFLMGGTAPSKQNKYHRP